MDSETSNNLGGDVSQLHLTESPIDNKDAATKSIGFKNKENVRDITAKFQTAAAALRTGQLLKDPSFTLFEAVGALEMMDPKMDSGYLENDDSLEDDWDAIQDLMPEEVVGVIDQMLSYEMAWHMGYPLLQSLFTSLHIDQLLWPVPKTLEDSLSDRSKKVRTETQPLSSVLRAYTIALIKTCGYVHSKIISEHYYEEEDFVSLLYNRDLLSAIDYLDAVKCLEKAIEDLSCKSIACEDNVKDALQVRLQLRKHLLLAVECDSRPTDRNAIQHWARCLESLPSVLQSHGEGVPKPTAFSAKIQRRLASSVPPRPIVDISFEDAHVHLRQICRNGSEVYRVLDYHGSSNLSAFVWTFQSTKPQPSIYIRCLLQSLIFHDMKVLGDMTITRLIFDDLAEIVLPAHFLVDPANSDVEAPQDPRFKVWKEMQSFVLRVGDAYLDLFRAMCMNRSRMRRMLCHLILDWESIQLEAENLDVELRQFTIEEPILDFTTSDEIWSFPLSSWAYYHKLNQMQWIVQMGLELDIYENDELAVMYWYLQNLSSNLIQHLERIQTFTTKSYRATVSLDAAQKTAYTQSFAFLDVELLKASAVQSFARGLCCLYVFLGQVGALSTRGRTAPYGKPEHRYSLRMRPFLQLSLPEVPPYADYASLIAFPPAPAIRPGDQEQAPSNLVLAEQAMKVARREWDAISKLSAATARCVTCEDWWEGSVKDVVRACIACSVAIATVKRGLANAEAEGRPLADVIQVEVVGSEMAYHPFWAVPKILPKR
ncbi:MAG: hypothetical protein Q9214_000008 [Letrouitia sp. 1 TL-2023]